MLSIRINMTTGLMVTIAHNSSNWPLENSLLYPETWLAKNTSCTDEMQFLEKFCISTLSKDNFELYIVMAGALFEL